MCFFKLCGHNPVLVTGPGWAQPGSGDRRSSGSRAHWGEVTALISGSLADAELAAARAGMERPGGGGWPGPRVAARGPQDT